MERRIFLCPKRPRSVNAKHSSTYKGFIRDAFERYCPAGILSQPLYSRTYYFKNKPNQLDADNLSKPIVDALTGVLYDDDRIVEFRQSAVINLQRNDISEFDVSSLPDNILIDLLGYLDSEDHLIYAEFGLLTNDKFTFGV